MAASASASASASPPSPLLPQEPLRYLSRPSPPASASAKDQQPYAPPTLDLSDLEQKIIASDDRRQAAFDLSRRISAAMAKCRAASERDGPSAGAAVEAESDLTELMGTVLDKSGQDDGAAAAEKRKGASPRDGNLSYKVEDYVRHLSYSHFLRTGKLLPPSSVPSATDEEYLAGACIGLSQDLARYGIGRATVRDTRSVRLARNLVSDVMDQLLLFDFRNGPLRRKYDGTKYALRTLETVLYELSVTGAEEDGGDGKKAEGGDGGDEEDMAEPEAKRSRVDDDGIEGTSAATEETVPTSELESLRKRMDHRDELRERLIKRCRDGQKAAKQSIFALHRGDAKRAWKLIEQCEECVRTDLLPIVTDEPMLRYGSFANVLEEYAEARLFYAWLHGDGSNTHSDDGGDGDSKGKDPSSSFRPVGTLLRLSDFDIHLEPEEYLGGLCDLTGEVGRFAVQRGTARDTSGVRLCLETNLSVLLSLQGLSRFPGGGIGKKMDPLRRSVEKLERMMYELSLVEATGGTRNVVVDSVKQEVGEGEQEGS